MVSLFVLFLVALGVTDITAVGGLYKVSVSAKGTTKCNGGPFYYLDKGNVSLIHRRYAGRGPPNKPLEELVLDSVPAKDGYFLSGTGEGGNYGTVVELFLRLTYVCGGKPGVREVQIPHDFIARILNDMIITIPPKVFEHDFSVVFVGPGRR